MAENIDLSVDLGFTPARESAQTGMEDVVELAQGYVDTLVDVHLPPTPGTPCTAEPGMDFQELAHDTVEDFVHGDGVPDEVQDTDIVPPSDEETTQGLPGLEELTQGPTAVGRRKPEKYLCRHPAREGDVHWCCEKCRTYKCTTTDRCPVCKEMPEEVFVRLEKSLRKSKMWDVYPNYADGMPVYWQEDVEGMVAQRVAEQKERRRVRKAAKWSETQMVSPPSQKKTCVSERSKSKSQGVAHKRRLDKPSTSYDVSAIPMEAGASTEAGQEPDTLKVLLPGIRARLCKENDVVYEIASSDEESCNAEVASITEDSRPPAMLAIPDAVDRGDMALVQSQIDPNTDDFYEQVAFLADYLKGTGQRVVFYYDGCAIVNNDTVVMPKIKFDSQVLAKQPVKIDDSVPHRSR